ncbi:hypothetical protein ACTQ49_08920 [Luteococcus sp. Sow4_B9]|uniref:hypothetical protein n=1 Tax=Luteococcus sp. Sow4_B9 TaxID=3438792 RepID=UPI003F9EA31F
MSSTHGEADGRFAQVLSDAIARHGLRLDEIRDALKAAGTPVSIATLSYWRNGRSLPARERSMRAVEQLERLLELGVGQLTGAIPSDALERWDIVKAANVSDQGLALLDAMGLKLRGQSSNEFLQDCVWAHRDGRQREETVQLLRAEIDGLDRVPIAFRMDFATDDPPLIESISGCELGRVVQLDDEGLQAAELLLPRPLATGELHLLEYSLDWDYGPAAARFGFSRVLPAVLETYVMQVHLAELPSSMEYHSLPNDYQGVDSDSDLIQVLEPRLHQQMVLSDALAGHHSVKWWYDEGQGRRDA